MRHLRIKPWIVILLLAAALAGGGAWWYFRPGGPGVTPSREQYPVRGIDISAHNGTIDFEQLATVESIDFVIIKATEGTAFKDAAFETNWLGATDAGIPVGAYHFFRFDSPGYMQALNMLHSVRGRHLDLPLVIDIEEWTNPDNQTTTNIVGQLNEFINTVEDAGYSVMLYTNGDGYERFIRGHFDRYPLWIASLSSEPREGWVLWQYTHRGSLSGTDSSTDINTFAGSRSDWLDWLSKYR